MDGSINSIPCTGVKESEEANPDVAVPEVLIDARRPFDDFDNFAINMNVESALRRVRGRNGGRAF